MTAVTLISLVAQLFFAGPAPVPAPPSETTLEVIETGFSAPLYVTAPTGDDRLFVVERGGQVKVLVNEEVVGTYLSVAHLLTNPRGSEQGLLGLAFDPAFKVNGHLFISYTDATGAVVIARYTANPSANTVSLATARTVIRIPQPATNHNGGMLAFGPDGYLYVGIGDGGGGGDPQGNGQNINTLLGSILRLDVDGDDFPTDSSRNYAIPSNNPFVGLNGADEIWIYGLRNPWRFSFDNATGRMYIGDVGQSFREEITVLEPGQQRGANLGWNLIEGTRCYPGGGTCSTSGIVLPQLDYVTTGGASVTGGYVYRGSRNPDLYGTYFYGDFIRGWVRSFGYSGSVTNHFDWSNEWNTSLVSSFGVDGHGEFYVVSFTGTLWRMSGPPLADELFFYRTDGTFRYYDILPNASLGSPIRSGSGYSQGWGIISAVDLDGDGLDEMFFYRSPGTYAYYDMGPDASLGGPIRAGDGYSHKWDVAQGVDIDGDGQDEMFFYDADTGLHAFYNISPNASLGGPIRYEFGYSTGWTSITAVDLDGDGTDEMLFYRNDGTFKYYETQTDGRLGALRSGGTGYSTGWTSITAVDLDGNGSDELLFYRNDGTFKYYETKSNGLGSLIRSGTGYSTGWTSITAVNLD